MGVAFGWCGVAGTKRRRFFAAAKCLVCGVGPGRRWWNAMPQLRSSNLLGCWTGRNWLGKQRVRARCIVELLGVRKKGPRRKTQEMGAALAEAGDPTFSLKGNATKRNRNRPPRAVRQRNLMNQRKFPRDWGSFCRGGLPPPPTPLENLLRSKAQGQAPEPPKKIRNRLQRQPTG